MQGACAVFLHTVASPDLVAQRERRTERLHQRIEQFAANQAGKHRPDRRGERGVVLIVNRVHEWCEATAKVKGSVSIGSEDGHWYDVEITAAFEGRLA